MFDVFVLLFVVKSRSNPPDVVLGNGVLKICCKFTGKHPYRSAVSIKLRCNFIEIAFRHGCSLVNLLHIFRTLLPKNTSGGLLLEKRVIDTNISFTDPFRINISSNSNVFQHSTTCIPEHWRPLK